MCRPQGRVALESVVRQAAAALEPLAAPDGITVDGGAASPACPPVIGDHDELVQLFQNLIHNAIKYGRERRPGAGSALGQRADGQVFARGAATMARAFPPSAMPRLTERFYRVDVKRSRERGGTGLGLAIVKHIVSRHQGRLSHRKQAGARAALSPSFCRPRRTGNAAKSRGLPSLSRKCYKTVA